MEPKRLVKSYTGMEEIYQLENRARKCNVEEEEDGTGSKKLFEGNFG
jgi:hypothetical protein